MLYWNWCGWVLSCILAKCLLSVVEPMAQSVPGLYFSNNSVNPRDLCDYHNMYVCSWSTPFKLGINFDSTESIDPTFATGTSIDNVENIKYTACNPTTPACFSGSGTNGFYLT